VHSRQLAGVGVRAQRAPWGKEKKSDVSKQLLFLAAAKKNLQFFPAFFFSLPCYETPKNAVKTNQGGKARGKQTK
jgi:hypothetical protein